MVQTIVELTNYRTLRKAPKFDLFSNHGQVLFTISKFPEMRMRDIAIKVGLTERAVQRIIDGLSTHSYIQVIKDGSRNHYRVSQTLNLPTTLGSHRGVGELLDFLFLDALEESK